MKIYPQFHPVDRKGSTSDMEVLLGLARLSPAELENKKQCFDEQMFEYSKIGEMVEESDILKLCQAMQAAAEKQGYPNGHNKTNTRAVEKEWGEIMHRMMGISRNEASKAGIWNALSCHYMPNLVAWRWENSKKLPEKISEHWLVQDRQERHAFGRLWWRYEVLKDRENKQDPYWILSKLQEDEVGQIMERSALASASEAVMQLAAIHINNLEEDSQGRMLALRRALKLLRLRASVRDLGALATRNKLQEFLSQIYSDANQL
jgi:hypothetical protein